MKGGQPLANPLNQGMGIPKMGGFGINLEGLKKDGIKDF